MAFKEIDKSILKTRFAISRKTVTKDSTGGIIESWTVVYPEIKGILSKESSMFGDGITGIKVVDNHVARFPAKFEGKAIILRENDKVYCKDNQTTYKVKEVDRVLNSAGNIHHHLVSMTAYREEVSEPQYITIEAKGFISND